MLWLTYTVGGDRFAIDATRVAEVLPAVVWKRVVGAPHGIVGMVNYHHTVVPLIDFSILVFGTPSAVRMHTRILLVRTELGDSASDPRLVGLLAEGMVGTLRRDVTDFVTPDDVTVTAPYLGPVSTDAQGILQRIEIDRLFAPLEYTQVLEQCAATQ